MELWYTQRVGSTCTHDKGWSCHVCQYTTCGLCCHVRRSAQPEVCMSLTRVYMILALSLWSICQCCPPFLLHGLIHTRLCCNTRSSCLGGGLMHHTYAERLQQHCKHLPCYKVTLPPIFKLPWLRLTPSSVYILLYVFTGWLHCKHLPSPAHTRLHAACHACSTFVCLFPLFNIASGVVGLIQYGSRAGRPVSLRLLRAGPLHVPAGLPGPCIWLSRNWYVCHRYALHQYARK